MQTLTFSIIFFFSVEVNGNSVCINFDGWSDGFNYWADINDPDFRPVGWGEYNEQRKQDDTLADGENILNVRFDPPKGKKKFKIKTNFSKFLKGHSLKIFNWENYLKENDIKAVPFDIFSHVIKSFF